MSDHTPTPWSWFEAGGSYYIKSDAETFEWRDAPHAQHIALVTKNYGPDTGTVREGREEANAERIVRAVNMYDRMLALIKTVEWGHRNICPSCDYAKWQGHSPICELAAILEEAKP